MIGLTLAGSLLFAAAAVHAQTDTTSTGTLNRQNSQYRTDTAQTAQPRIQDTRNKSRTTGSENNQIKNNIDSLNTGSQGTTSGSTPYDTTGMAPTSDYNSSTTESNGMSGTQPTGDGSGNTSGTTGTGPTGASTSGAPGHPRYEGDVSDSKDRSELTKTPKKTMKKKKSSE